MKSVSRFPAKAIATARESYTPIRVVSSFSSGLLAAVNRSILSAPPVPNRNSTSYPDFPKAMAALEIGNRLLGLSIEFIGKERLCFHFFLNIVIY